MAARPLRFRAEADLFQQIGGTLQHLRFAQDIQPAHRDHDVFLGGEIFEKKMELEDEPEQLVAFSRQRVIDQMRDRFVFDRDPAGVRLVKQAENVKQRALAAARGSDHGVNGSALELKRNAAKRVDARIVFAQIAFDAFATERNFQLHLCLSLRRLARLGRFRGRDGLFN